VSITRCIQPPADAIWFAGWWIPWLCFHQVVGPEPVISLPCGTKCFWNGYQLGGRIKDYTKRNPKKTRHFLPVVTLLQKSSSQQQVDRCFFPRQSAWRVDLPQRSSFELKIYNILNSKRPLFASDGRQNRNELPHNLLQYNDGDSGFCLSPGKRVKRISSSDKSQSQRRLRHFAKQLLFSTDVHCFHTAASVRRTKPSCLPIAHLNLFFSRKIFPWRQVWRRRRRDGGEMRLLCSAVSSNRCPDADGFAKLMWWLDNG
jgi:hypothetical protein